MVESWVVSSAVGWAEWSAALKAELMVALKVARTASSLAAWKAAEMAA